MTLDANPLTQRATARGQPSRSAMTMSASDLRALMDAFERLGYYVEGLLLSARLRRSDLADPDARFPLEIYPAIFAQAQEQRFTPNLALRLAGATPIGAFPLLDYLVLTSENVGSGIRQLSRYFRLVGNPITLEVHETPKQIDVATAGSSAPFGVEYTLSIIVLHLHEETEGRFAPTSVSFSHRPDDPGEFERTLGCPIYVGASWSGLTVSRDAWGVPLRRRDPVLRSVLEKQADEVVAKLPARNDLRAAVKRALDTRIAGGDTRISNVARELAISPRTLQRRLAAEGASYQTLLENARKEAVGRHLSTSPLAISEVAFLLGYSEPASFHRAFKRWYGVTPQAFRMKQQGARYRVGGIKEGSKSVAH